MSAQSLFRRITQAGQFTSYFNKPKDVETFRKQIIYRSSNLGMLELDLIIGTWAKKNVPKFTEEECMKYNAQILNKETPDLYKLVLGIDKTLKIENYEEYPRILREFAESGKALQNTDEN